MRNWTALALLGGLAAACAGRPAPVSAPRESAERSMAAPAAAGRERLRYPETRRVDQVDTYHGVQVPDPYRWLEDPDSPETRVWVEAQNRLTFGYLESIPARERIRRRLSELWDYERYGVPEREGGRYFYTRIEGLQNQPLVYTLESLEGEPRVLLDPNALSPDGTIALTDYEVSEDGRLMAYGLSSGGSDWEEWRVRDVATGRDLPDRLEWVKFSTAAWTHDHQGFFYSRYDEPAAGQELEQANYNQKLYYHRVGTPQSEDRLVYARPDQPEWGIAGQVTDDGRYLILFITRGTDVENAIFYQDLAAPGATTAPTPPVVELLKEFDAPYLFLGNDGPVFWFQTNLGAPRGRVIAVDTRDPARERWRELVPQAAETIEAARVVGDRFLISYLKDAHSQIRLFDLAGRLEREVELPGLGAAGGFTGERSDPEAFFYFTSFTVPTTVYRCDAATGRSTVFRRPRVDFDPALYETRQVFYASKDGTRVPMFLSYRKGVRRDGTNPVLLHGYGGFNIPLTPEFSIARLVWMELGGVYAVANLRGGGEYGQEWYKSGILHRKQKGFDDFLAAAEWLVADGWTSRERLAVTGRSNGGLLVGAVITQRPELFGAAIAGVGVLDMLRFHKFTIGWAWTSDYGSPDDPEDFQVLRAYSPYHNTRPGTAYPATLITTADHDDRVVPAHSFKFAAALQAAQGGADPVLIRIETRAGHGAGKPTTKKIEEAADELAFLVRELGMAEGAAARQVAAGETP